MTGQEDLVWAGAAFWRRCRARLEPGRDARHGQCELERHAPEVDHALDYGMHVIRFRTDVTG